LKGKSLGFSHPSSGSISATVHACHGLKSETAQGGFRPGRCLPPFDGPDYIGNWDARCPDGTQGRGIAVVTPAFFDQVLVAGLGLQGQQVFGGCGWSTLATRDGNRLRGDWDTAQSCQTGPVLRGRLDLTKR